MLPSLLTRDIQDGLKQFLTTGFEPSDHHLHGLMARLVAREDGIDAAIEQTLAFLKAWRDDDTAGGCKAALRQRHPPS